MKRICPKCTHEFARAKRKDKVPHCPSCDVAMYYPTGKLKGKTLLYEDKEDVDYAIKRVCEAHEDFGTHGPNAERHFAYDMLFRCKVYLERRGQIMDYHKFFRGLIDYILEQKWWKDNLKSLIMLKNRIANFAKEFYDLQSAEMTVETSLDATSNSWMG